MSTFFLSSKTSPSPGAPVLFGAPFDGTSSYRPGSRFGPHAIRAASQSIESFSPYLCRDLEEIRLHDAGDLEITPGSAEKMVGQVRRYIETLIKNNHIPAMLGGEHTVALGGVQALANHHSNLHVLQLDAHTDLRDDYLGLRVSHATVLRRIEEITGSERVHRMGIRSGMREEFESAGAALPLALDDEFWDVERLVGGIPSDAALYITVDLDVFDPSLLPGVGNPEPGGMTWETFIKLVKTLSRFTIVGFDAVELAPGFDASGASAVIAAELVRELLLCAVPRR